MKTVLMKYICVILILYLIFTNMPKHLIYVKDIYLFIAMGLIIFYIANKYLLCSVETFVEDDDESSKPESTVLVEPTMLVEPTVPEKSNNDSALIAKLINKIDNLEKTITSLNEEKNNIPKFLQQMADNGKYIDRDGIVKDAMYGDMKYNQLKPSQMQPQMTREDDEWDTTGYSILNTDKWKPVQGEVKDVYQEGQCPVYPNKTSGYPVNVMNFDESRHVMGADNISIDYIKKLNDPKKF